MKCPGKSGESYDLFAFGALEEPEREEIQSHLNQGCETCVTEVRHGLELSSMFAVALTALDDKPPVAIRKRVLEAVSKGGPATAPTAFWHFAIPLWRQAMAAVLLIAAGSGLGWLATRSIQRPAEPARVNVVADTHVQRIQALEEQVRDLQNGLTGAESRLKETARKIPAAGEALSAAQAELSRVQRLYADVSGTLSATEAELRKNQTLLVSAQKARQEAEQQLTAAASDRDRLVAERRQQSDRERQLAARNTELQQEVERYKAAVNTQSARVAPLMRLASTLSSPSLKILRLQGAEGHSGISGSAFLADSSGVMVYAAGLPALQRGKTYQLWLMRRDSPAIVSGGVFKVDQNGGAFIEVNPSALTKDVLTVAVTDEPEGGSPLPTGHKFFIGVRS